MAAGNRRLRIGRGLGGKFFRDGDRALVRRDGCHVAVGVSQHEARQLVPGPAPYRAVEIDRPDGGARADGNVTHQKRGVRQIELQVERVALRRAYRQRRIEIHLHGHGQARSRPLRVLHLDLARRNRGARGGRKAHLGIGGGGEQDVAGVAAHGEHGTGVGAHGNAGVAENFIELIEHHQIRDGGGGRGRVDGDIRAAALRHERDRQDLHADRRPVLRGRIAHQHGDVCALRSGSLRRGHRGAGAAAACGQNRSGQADRQ